MAVPQHERGDQRAPEDEQEEQVHPERSEERVRTGRVALRRDHELALAAQYGVEQRPGVDRRGQRGHHHAGDAAGTLRLVRRDIVPPVPDVQTDLERRGIAVEHHPHRRIDLHTRGPQPQEQRTTERRQNPVQRRHRVEDHHHGVVEEPARGQRERRLPELLEDRLVRPARPAQLLGEEVGPGRGPLADREHIRGVDRAPLLPGLRIAVPVHLETGRHVLGDRVVQPADLLERADAHGVGRADEHRRAIAVAGPLDQRMEEELL